MANCCATLRQAGSSRLACSAEGRRAPNMRITKTFCNGRQNITTTAPKCSPAKAQNPTCHQICTGTQKTTSDTNHMGTMATNGSTAVSDDISTERWALRERLMPSHWFAGGGACSTVHNLERSLHRRVQRDFHGQLAFPNATAERGSLPPKVSCREPLSRLT